MRGDLSWWARHVGAGASLVAALRFSAFEWSAWSHADVRVVETARLVEPSRPAPVDLDELKRYAGSELTEAESIEARPKLRRILVDWGQERSRVYINGHYVGDTPYGGHVTCLDGDQLAVVLLPPSGPPSSRIVSCHASTDDSDGDSSAAVDGVGSEAKGGQAPPSKAIPSRVHLEEGAQASNSQQITQLTEARGEPSGARMRALQLALEEAQRAAESRQKSFPE